MLGGFVFFCTMSIVRQHKDGFIPVPVLMILSLRCSYQYCASVVNRRMKLYANDLTPSYTCRAAMHISTFCTHAYTYTVVCFAP
jgi:hypothetical protein